MYCTSTFKDLYLAELNNSFADAPTERLWKASEEVRSFDLLQPEMKAISRMTKNFVFIIKGLWMWWKQILFQNKYKIKS